MRKTRLVMDLWQLKKAVGQRQVTRSSGKIMGKPMELLILKRYSPPDGPNDETIG